ncbi:DUF4136 domain-containing protein [Christiangramia sabulilitoris]|uniref:DUF4136 domain-containing protein n=1 Tax=Christiangramia sabulilitoris TaxID=2583991 RepID=A0A550I413_9FLAO|nr:DUF4136 domain-containing protein [Christiangramia sabulilitoris]TRO65715.1 DUF4136 domain-containing protein [Christiangramia sabulilitoris]
MKFSRYLILFIFITACNSPRAVYDYDQNVNFEQYSTYAIFPELQTGLSQLDESRLLESVRSGFQQKGLESTDQPGLFLNLYTERFEQDNRNRLGVGIGGGGGNVGVGVSGGVPIGQMDTYIRLTFDLIDVKNDKLVWQAIVEGPFDLNAKPEQRKMFFDKIVAKALEKYPPEN